MDGVSELRCGHGAMKCCVAPGISWCPGVSGGTVISPIVNPVEWIESWQRYKATASVILFKCVLVSPIDDRVEWMVFFLLHYRYGAMKRCVAPGISWCPGVSGGTVISPIVNQVE